MDDSGSNAARARRLRGNEVVVLDDPRSGWIIESGSVAVFGVALRDGAPAGPRRFLFSGSPGDALLGLALPESAQPGVIAVALEPTVLQEIEPGRRTADPRAAEACRRWLAHWHAAVGLELGEDGPAGATDGAERLAAAHETLVRRLHELDAAERRAERARFEQRILGSRDAAGRAVAELTSVLDPGQQELTAGPALFVAAGAAARAQGITLRQPALWEETEGAGEPVERIARASHVRSRQVVLHDGWWRQDCGPLLAFLGRERKPVALLPHGSRAYRMLDPATGERVVVDGTLAAEIEPEAHVFYRPLPERAHRGVELLRFALRGRSRDLLLVLSTAVGATLLGMFTPQATALLVDNAIPDGNTGLLVQIGIGLAAAALGSAAFRLSQGLATMRVETAADAATQAAVWDRLLNLQLSFFRRFSTGDLQSRVTAISQIRSYLGGTTLRTLFSSVVLLLNLALLLYYSPTLTLIALGVAAASSAVTVVSGVMILRCSRQILELRGRFFGLMVQLIQGISKLRVAAAEERAFARWASDYGRLLRLEVRQQQIHDAVQVANVAISTISAILLFAVAATLVGRVGGGAALSTGIFLAFHVAFGTFIAAVTSLSNTVTDVMAIAVLRERAKPILEAVPEVSDQKSDPGRLAGRLDLEHVSFRYLEDGPLVLDDVSVQVQAGQFVAVVGPSGSGKSTLFRLLLGFESPRTGSIFYDGQDLSGLDVHAVRRQMGVVLQSGRINAGSIFDNIAAGTRVSLNDAWEAARATAFADEISAMPMGMHTVISEGGTNLSGGQRQRLLLTRALVHRPRVLLLDEATSALDNRTQAIVSESLRGLRVTRLVIAHRLSTIRDADQIYVIEGGRVVQRGGFAELGGQDGLFARLMARQLT